MELLIPVFIVVFLILLIRAAVFGIAVLATICVLIAGLIFALRWVFLIGLMILSLHADTGNWGIDVSIILFSLWRLFVQITTVLEEA